MPIAAVPAYLGKDFRTASPGMRFGMFLELWGVNSRTGKRLWSTHDINYRQAGPRRQQREFKDEQKTHAINSACRLSSNDKSLMQAAGARQQAIASWIPETNHFRKTTKSIAPFTTGLGNEHPLENGFSFLNPYGLPYLPGSGVKGVVRRSAKELASGEWGDSHGWHKEQRHSLTSKPRDANELCLIDALFGLESTSGEDRQFRGLLTFWDVIPQIRGSRLAVDVMTPHQAHYFQNGESPHDSGSPNPIAFLTVPPRSEFTFHVSCDTRRLRRMTASDASLTRYAAWKDLLDAAFAHAFQWLGFGAKTAVGYGTMRFDAEREEQARRESEAGDRAEKLKKMDDIDRDIEEFLANRPDKGMPKTTAILQALKSGRWSGDKKREVAVRLKARMQEDGKWKETSHAKQPEKDKPYQKTLAVMAMLE